MSNNETSPLLATAAKNKASADDRNNSAESTPLLAGGSDAPHYDGEHDEPDRGDAASVRSRRSEAASTWINKYTSVRWASYIAMVILACLIMAIILLAFLIPESVQEYAQQAAVIEPTKLSLDSITTDGVRARIQADFHLDANKVQNDNVKRIGQATTWVARQIGTDETKIDVYLPDYEHTLLGSTVIPPLVVNIRDGEKTSLDFVVDIIPGDLDGIRVIAKEWLEGSLQELRLEGKADITAKSGIIPLGTHSISESLLFEANKIPAMPKYNITRFNIKDGPMKQTMLAEVTLSAFNEYPIELDIPELAFEILVPGCSNMDPTILVADAVTSEVHVEPHAEVEANAYGVVREIPEALTRACPNSNSSPLDLLLQQYLNGDSATLFVRGSSHPDGNTPKWISDILASITLPVPFPAGRDLDGLIRSFSLTDVHFTMPDPLAGPDDPDSNPKISGNILVIAGLPSEMNFDIDVTGVRATADVQYKSRKLGELNLKKWQRANSSRVEGEGDDGPTLKIQSRIIDAPLTITDSDVFSEVVQALIFGSKTIRLSIDALVDVKVETSLGKLILKEVPAQGKIPVKPLPHGSLGSVSPKVSSIHILDTTADSITLQALVNVTNPTPYTAHVPFVNIHIMSNGTILGEATVENLDIVQGANSNVLVTATWNPSLGDEVGRDMGRNLISQYVSGWNTTLTVKAHKDSIPGQRLLCEALSRFNMTFATPRLSLPGDKPGERSHFIRDATFHFVSSTATFTLVSPLQFNTIYLDFVNATALYNHTDPVGEILYDLPFAAPPGRSQTPRLPVTWSLDSVGYDAVRKAVGGELKLDAYANVDIRLGNWRESLWYQGKGIGAHIRL